MRSEDVKISEGWRHALAPVFIQQAFDEVVTRLKQEKALGKTVYPPGSLIFNAFDLSRWEATKVVILGQDPYHGPNQAMGLSFSVPKGVRVPPSLRNIYKELSDDVGFQMVHHGDLTHWANQGVLLLNAILTVEAGNAGSHKDMGWQWFTDEVIKTISQHKKYVVFMLWGNFAIQKATLIDESKHLVLKAPHPSPLARGGFFGCKHFSKANAYLESKGLESVDWQLKS